MNKEGERRGEGEGGWNRSGEKARKKGWGGRKGDKMRERFEGSPPLNYGIVGEII